MNTKQGTCACGPESAAHHVATQYKPDVEGQPVRGCMVFRITDEGPNDFTSHMCEPADIATAISLLLRVCKDSGGSLEALAVAIRYPGEMVDIPGFSQGSAH